MNLNLSPLETVVYFTFIVSFFGMIAGSVFFAMQRNAVPKDYQSSMVITAIILLIAAMNYYYMKEIYLIGIADGSETFPTEFRYIDWLLTVPLMLIKFPSMLGLGPKGLRFLVILVVLSLLMITTGFLGEINFDQPTIHYGLFAVGSVAWLLIVAMLFFSLSDLPEQVDHFKRTAITRMAWFVLIGWAIYPLGYLAPTFGLEPAVRELVYNVGDLINKVGLGLFVFAAGVASAKYQRELAAYQSQVAEGDVPYEEQTSA
ncbi:MAG: bacteriorhodopsin [Verrucomicrobiota bacterium]